MTRVLSDQCRPTVAGSSSDHNPVCNEQAMKNIKGSSSYTEQSDSCDACQRCYIEIEQLRADNSNILQTVATLRDAIQQLHTEFESYRLSHPEAPVVWPQPLSFSTVESLAAVHSQLTEKERHKQNVVVTGMKEVEDADDIDAFSVLCERCLPVKPSVLRERCCRLGQRIPVKTQPESSRENSATSHHTYK